MNDINPPGEHRPAEEARLVAAAKKALKKSGEGSWEAADAFLALSQRGWRQRRIAEACEVSQTSVCWFLGCARRFPRESTRPSFWHAYEQVRADKREPEPPPKTVSGSVRVEPDGPTEPIVIRVREGPASAPVKPPARPAAAEEPAGAAADEPAEEAAPADAPAAGGRAAAGRRVPFSLVGTPGLRSTPLTTAVLMEAVEAFRSVGARWASYRFPELEEVLAAIDRLPRGGRP